MKTTTFTIKDMHCASCPIMIEGTLEDDVKGVVSAKARYVQQDCIVEYDEAVVSPDGLIEAIEGIGYVATVTD